VKSTVVNILRQRKRRIFRRIENRPGPEQERPMMSADNIQYELADRVQGLAAGGIGAMLLLTRRTGTEAAALGASACDSAFEGTDGPAVRCHPNAFFVSFVAFCSNL
jgi:hypothetical protein